MKRALLCLLLLLCLCCTGCVGSEEHARAARIRSIGQTLQIDLSDAEIVYYRNSHGGFHGDGELALCMQLPGAYAGTLPSRYWQELPLSEHIRQWVFGSSGRFNGFIFNDKIPEGMAFPEPESGCWFIYDRFGLSRRDDPYPADISRYSDTLILEHGAWNVSFAWIDAETNRLYYIELDT